MRKPKKGVFKRVVALMRGHCICRIYDEHGLVHECFGLNLALHAIERFREQCPDHKFDLRLEVI